MKNVEILAPAGSFESMVGAFRAGADAVYMGGSMFGARAYANNPDNERLLWAIDYAHIHGKQLYLTVNTLLKEDELEKELYEYMYPLYLQGLDAAIVQDVGVMSALREWFPDLAVHASTQMTVVSKDHAGFLKAMGVSRIVPARELSLEEIKNLKEAFGGEIECFVHGALCYCYSGQCLLSSMLGGRSGNRGRCAQPCRLPYGVAAGKGRSEAYWLSPKDICTLDILPELVDAGIDSFKIEGRMKKPEYAAFAAHVYRKYTDMYLEHGREGYGVDVADRQALMDLYNRGGFSYGYYKQHNGREMMSVHRPNHFGSPVGAVKKAEGLNAFVDVKTPLFAGDVVMAEGMPDKAAVTLKNDFFAPGLLRLRFQTPISPGTTIFRVRCEHLIKKIKEQFLDGKDQENIYVSLMLLKELPAKMQLSCQRILVTVLGPVVQTAQNQPLSRENVEERVKKTGDTPFRVETLELAMDENIYVPIQALNQLRRDGIKALQSALLEQWRRPPQSASERGYGAETFHTTNESDHPQTVRRAALIQELSMAKVLMEFPQLSVVYLESWTLENRDFFKVAKRLKDAGKQVYLALPYVFREASKKKWEHYGEALLSHTRADKNSEDSIIDGFLVRNMEGLAFLKELGLDARAELVADYMLYTMNRRAAVYYKNLGFNRVTAPAELNFRELKTWGSAEDELLVYGYLPLMVSAQCVTKNISGCSKHPGMCTLTDRYGKSFAVRNVCSDCYNLIYNSQPTVLYDLTDKLKTLKPGVMRYQFTNESPEMIRRILGCTDKNVTKDFTRGHFNRGVE